VRSLAEEGIDWPFSASVSELRIPAPHCPSSGGRTRAVQLLITASSAYVGTVTHPGHALGQAAHALGCSGMVEVGVVERRFEIHSAVATSMASAGAGATPAATGWLATEPSTWASLSPPVELFQRLADEMELFVERGQAVQLVTGTAAQLSLAAVTRFLPGQSRLDR